MIKVYTTPTCMYCHALMEWLDQQGIEYQEIDATNLSEAEAAAIEGINVVPVTIIGDQKIIGFDRPAIKKALEDAKN